ncbi:MAG: tRNA (guanosine(37)-N1)-methyltransferase TrmD [Gammaproteobacteria bacterium]|nr:tRNA (guanosine(37)-N1)-methyltransferase TrmD [Gammaproteobacteria bacterium]
MNNPLDCTVISIFPELIESVASVGVVGKAVDRGLASMTSVNPRDFTTDKHRTVDDRPYGGGAGMVMKPEPLARAVAWVKAEKPDAYVIYPSPQGAVLDDATVNRLIALNRPLVMVAGRYEGVDERFIERYVDEEISLGDFVLSGGELPCMVLFDAMVRKLPGALGNEHSAIEDSFVDGVLDCPHYTRPEEFEGLLVPEVLRGGNHAAIKKWRAEQAMLRTAQRRPDLLKQGE